MTEKTSVDRAPVDAVVSRALIGRLPCGCVVAADLDNCPRSAAEYVKRGYAIETVTRDEAKRLIRESNCQHG